MILTSVASYAAVLEYVKEGETPIGAKMLMLMVLAFSSTSGELAPRRAIGALTMDSTVAFSYEQILKVWFESVGPNKRVLSLPG